MGSSVVSKLYTSTVPSSRETIISGTPSANISKKSMALMPDKCFGLATSHLTVAEILFHKTIDIQE